MTPLALPILAALLAAGFADAACPSSESVLSELTCSSSVTGRIAGRDASDLGGSCASGDCYTCGSPTASMTQTSAEDVYSFTCQRSGTVNLSISGLDCNLDLYVLDDTCDPDGGCVQGTDHSGASVDGVTFSCTAGDTYYVVVEGNGFGLPSGAMGACNRPDSGDYTLTFNLAGSTGCGEDCDDGADNDLDGYTDCADTDCDADPVCAHDADHDGYLDSTYGGDDCDDADASIHPGADEVCDGLDDDCDGDVDGATSLDAYTWYRDADGDAYGSPSVSLDACTLPTGYVADATDCDDTRAATNPGAAETCNGRDDDCDGTADDGLGALWYADADADGYGDAGDTRFQCAAPTGYLADASDCDDTLATVNPAATERCDAVDNDCDGLTDEGLATSWYADADGDGYGDPGVLVSACAAPTGYVANATDCDDGAATTHPGASESCDGADDDCDGTIDEGVTTTWYADADGDGHGDPDSTVAACSAPAGYVGNASDCDDGSAATYPSATEWCDGIDNDCDGSIDEADAADVYTWYRDADADGYGDAAITLDACSAPTGYVPDPSDCDDTLASTHPGAAESCDGQDDDCDGTIDEDAGPAWYADADGDGYGDPTVSTSACSAPSGSVASSTDCDDTTSTVHPGATETCDGVDDDCDGAVDEAGGTTWYRDADADGYGNAALTTVACSAPLGYVATATDCDDGDGATSPDATELCDGYDDDCDGAVDESSAADAWTWHRDADADGYGDAASTVDACSAPSGYVLDDTDCADTLADTFPGAPELCDGRDNDCDGTADDGTGPSWYLDADADGYGDATLAVSACEAPAGYVADPTDCDDTSATVSPGAAETCDGVDDDCDGAIDEAGGVAWYLDADGDGYGNDARSTTNCTAPTGYVGTAGDCDDDAAATSPAATETCDGLDDDCDGAVDEPSAVDAYTWYRDADADGYGDGALPVDACAAPTGYVGDATDCDDTRSVTRPGAPEACDGLDNDCDGTIDNGSTSPFFADVDGDGFGDPDALTLACAAPPGTVTDDTDCDDTSASVNPVAAETCDGVDDDCDGSVDEEGGVAWYADLDGDGVGTSATSVVACTAPSGYVAAGGDCDDATASIYPGAPEWCDGLDDDCDGTVDEGDADDAYTWYRDADADGYGDEGAALDACVRPSGYVSDGGDCDDLHPDVHPGATETCDGSDEDCDGTADDGAGTAWYADADGDGAGDPSVVTTACSAPDGATDQGDDCDDTNPEVGPEAAERCNGIDDDCDGEVDEDAAGGVDTGSAEPDSGDTAEGSTGAWYADADGDGYGEGDPIYACTAPEGAVAEAGDCDDADDAVHPGATERCDGVDDDCDGSVDGSDAADAATWFHDADADGYGDVADPLVACTLPAGFVTSSDDCDDARPEVHPGAAETCDDLDDDCDGGTDEGVGTLWYTDADADGFGTITSPVTACTAPAGTVADASDCDDGDLTVNPSAPERCDGIDQDCDGVADDGLGAAWYADADGDGFGDATVPSTACVAPSGYVADASDCDDADAAAHPGAAERCNGIDDDCDDVTDESAGTTWHADADGDGFGSPTSTTTACSAPAGYVADATDCDDSTAAANPGVAERCDGHDNDCDGGVDETGGTAWYADADADGYGAASVALTACEAPSGYVADDQDCDDTRAAVHPGAPETCDGLDDDCDGSLDETGGTPWYADADADGYGDPARTVTSCVLPVGYVLDGTDCDDTNATVAPGASERCNGVDDDCDVRVDEDATDATTWHADTDADGYGDPAVTTTACAEPAGYVADATDCWDASSATHPGATELADGADNDCDGAVDEASDAGDDDGDGYAERGGDCDDADPEVHPGAVEDADGVDDDCDGTVDEGTETYDDDGDGADELDGDCNDGDPAVGPARAEVDLDGIDNNCDGTIDGGATDTDGDGYGTGGGDCDDTDATVYPHAPELADGIDNDCDGTIDEGTRNSDDDHDGQSEADGDCNDADASIYVGAPEGDDGVDDDCDGFVDEGSSAADDDGDGYSEATGDCDDANPAVHPGATENADGVDDDCNGLVDDALTDFDDDGFSQGDGDCNDFDPWTNPGAYEVCDGHDNNCNAAVDEGCGDDDSGVPVTTYTVSCGSSSGSSAAALLLLPALLAFGVRRKRRGA